MADDRLDLAKIGTAPSGAGLAFLDSLGAPTHFSPAELSCDCGCGSFGAAVELVELLERIRALLGNRPLHITSGLRCWTYNNLIYTRQGLQPTGHSQHLPRDLNGQILKDRGPIAPDFGGCRAADIVHSRLAPREVQETLREARESLGIKGFGVYPGFTHVDVRTGDPGSWAQE